MEAFKQYPVNLHEIYKARKVVAQHLSPTPLVHYQGLSDLLGFEVYVKHENRNLTNSFKIRGGINMMAQLKQAGVSGVVTFSTGNHGLSVASAAKLANIPAIVVVPEASNPVKVALIKAAGAEVVEAGKNFDESAKVVAEISANKGYYYVHPVDEPHVINGVGSEFLEILDELPDIDAMIIPLGGGSEVASAVTVFKTIQPKIDIYAVQAELSCAAYQSWSNGEIVERSNQTFAGGFATGTAYQTTFEIYRNALTDFVLLSEEEILQGIALAAHHTKHLVEAAGSASLMAAWKLRAQLKGKKVVLQFSGANASPQELERACQLACFTHGRFE